MATESQFSDLSDWCALIWEALHLQVQCVFLECRQQVYYVLVTLLLLLVTGGPLPD